MTYDTPALFDPAKPLKAGSNLPVKVQLLDAWGTNFSSAAISVSLATPVALVGPTGVPVARQPSGSFVFVSKRGSDPMYQYDLKTTGLGTGSYTLYFMVGGDDFEHSLSFIIR